MWTLNLVDKESSDLSYTISNFPDGQQNIKLTGFTKISNPFPSSLLGNSVKILSRLRNFKDLELIVCANQAIKRIFPEIEVLLYVPYLLGARSDRQFSEGEPSYLVDVVAPIINLQKFYKVLTLDIHSDVAAACIDRLEVTSNISLAQWALTDFPDGFTLLSPDGGSLKKVYKVADAIGYKGDVIICSKFRDESGKLSRVHVPMVIGKHADKPIIIIDDICDGGRTFIEIAKKVKEYNYNNKIYLIVTHGIFSAGICGLMELDGIYTTNSYNTVAKGGLPAREVKWVEDNIKQLNVF